MKDLEVLGRDLSKVAIIDNSVEAMGFQLHNGVLIDDYFGDSGDEFLLEMITFLNILNGCEDSRDAVVQFFMST